MKIYLYDRETGIYLGEDFADEALLGAGCVVPCDATTVAPPHAAKEEVLVFDTVRNIWAVRRPESGGC